MSVVENTWMNVGPLNDLCLLAVRNAIENGQVGTNFDLPLMFRQQLFDLAQMRPQLNRNVARVCARECFVENFSHLRLIVFDDDDETVDVGGSLLQTLIATFRHGPELVKAITSVSLSFRLANSDDYRRPNKAAIRDVSPEVNDVCRILELCSNLSSFSVTADYPGNRLSANLRLLFERLSEGMLATRMRHLRRLALRNVTPDPQFFALGYSSLESLCFHNIHVDPQSWRLLLANSAWSLRELTACYVHLGPYGALLPVPLPVLASLTIVQHVCSVCPSVVAEHCPALTRATLSMDAALIKKSDMKALDTLPSDLRFHIQVGRFDCSTKLPQFIHRARARNRQILIDFRAQTSSTKVPGHLLADCYRAVGVTLSGAIGNTRPDVAGGFLIRMISDEVQAWKLSKLELTGILDANIVADIFNNCYGLDQLSLKSSLNHLSVDDNHIRVWLRNGARPSSVSIYNIVGLSQDGIVALLSGCGYVLRSLLIEFAVRNDSLNCSLILSVLLEQCKFLETVSFDEMYPLASERRDEIRRKMFSPVVFKKSST